MIFSGKRSRFPTILCFVLLGLAFLGLAIANPVKAASSPWVQAQEAELRLVSESSTVGSDDTLRLGLEFKLSPHWKIYWRSPGEAGLPPTADFAGSTNFDSATISWPLPERFAYLGIETFGYQDQVVLPIDVKLAEAGKETNIKLKVDYLICEELCIPGTADLALTLPAGAVTEDMEASLIAVAMSQVPTANNDFIAVENFTLDMKGEKPVLMVSASSTQGMVDPQLIVEGPEAYYFNPFEREISDDLKFATFTTTAELMYEPDELMSRNNLRLTLVDGVEAVEVGAADMPNATGQALTKNVVTEPIGLSVLLSMLFAALLGGLILNLMPCVLPVLSIKLMSVIDKSGQSNAKVRLGFLATTAGIITSFLALAAALIVLKSVGASIGWGVQFQQPLFVLALLAIILLFAANMFGWFEIGLPHSVSGLGAGGQNKGLLSDFATGAFATLLATPCSAPFLGTAVSFALAQNAATILLIFAALGVGMALPYILVMVFPRLISYLPRPGLWMVKLRVVLGGLLVLTAIWLTSILLTQLGLVSTVVTVLLSIVLLAAVWVFRASGKKLIATAVLTSVALLLVPPMFKADFSQNTSKLEAPWVVFDQQAIATHIAEGKVVYVDVTADWCVTCKVNKAIVFASDDVNAAFASTHLVAMVADWTRPSTEINAYLQSFNRAGIPFNALYSAKHPNGKALPEILTPKLVLEELANAK